MKNVIGFIGFAVCIGTIIGGNLKSIGDWSSAEMVGFNTWSIIAVVGGGYLAYWSIAKKNKK